MTRVVSAAAATALTLGIFGALATSAFAQSYTAPAGIPAATAPGGLEGRDGLINALQHRQGRYVVAPRAYDDLSTSSISLRGSRVTNTVR